MNPNYAKALCAVVDFLVDACRLMWAVTKLTLWALVAVALLWLGIQLISAFAR